MSWSPWGPAMPSASSLSSTTTRARPPRRLLILYKSDFDALMEGNPRIAVVVMRNLSRLLAIYARRNPVLVGEPGPRPEKIGPP